MVILSEIFHKFSPRQGQGGPGSSSGVTGKGEVGEIQNKKVVNNQVNHQVNHQVNNQVNHLANQGEEKDNNKQQKVDNQPMVVNQNQQRGGGGGVNGAAQSQQQAAQGGVEQRLGAGHQGQGGQHHHGRQIETATEFGDVAQYRELNAIGTGQ